MNQRKNKFSIFLLLIVSSIFTFFDSRFQVVNGRTHEKKLLFKLINFTSVCLWFLIEANKLALIYPKTFAMKYNNIKSSKSIQIGELRYKMCQNDKIP